MSDLVPTPSINDVRSKAHMALVRRLGGLDLSPILVYRIASLIDSAVLAMAWQWDVLNPLLLPSVSQIVTLSYPSWDQIANIDTLINIDLLQYQTERPGSPPLSVLYAQYRALILLSTHLHSIMGTVGAIKQALAGLGYVGAIVQEGQNSWGGSSWPSNEGWAVFRVLINLATVPLDTDFTSLEQRMTAICNYWKPARCWLDSIQFQSYLQDQLLPAPSDLERGIYRQRDFLPIAPSDFITTSAGPRTDIKKIVPYCNAQYYASNSITCGGTQPAVAQGPVIVNGQAVETT